MIITQLGNPVLRKVAKPMREIKRGELDTLIKAMIQTMVKARGVGIAAPQVGKSIRLFIIASRPNSRYPGAPAMKPLAMINPRLVSHSKTMNTLIEGCLSIPGIRGPVRRYNQVRVRFFDPSGDLKEAALSGFVARIFQHEFDHINGKVFIDRVRDTRKLLTEKEYQRLISSR